MTFNEVKEKTIQSFPCLQLVTKPKLWIRVFTISLLQQKKIEKIKYHSLFNLSLKGSLNGHINKKFKDRT